MDLREEKIGEVSMLGVAGRIDSSTAPALEKHLTENLGAAKVRVVLDLSRLEYISSAGFRILLSRQSAPMRPGVAWYCAAWWEGEATL